MKPQDQGLHFPFWVVLTVNSPFNECSHPSFSKKKQFVSRRNDGHDLISIILGLHQLCLPAIAKNQTSKGFKYSEKKKKKKMEKALYW